MNRKVSDRCGTDLHIFDGEAKTQPLVIMKREYAGTIVEIRSCSLINNATEEVE